MRRVAPYARVSTEDQVNGYSIDGQLSAMREYAEQHGWEVVEEYVDAGFSARTDNRPAFKRMIADAKQRKLDVVLVLRGDRFARNRMHAAMYKQLLKEMGVRVISVTEPIEEGTPSGVIVEGVNEVIAEWYSVDLSVKITDAKRRRAEKGLWNGPVPFAYLPTGEGTLKIVTGEADKLRRAFEMYASGCSTYQKIATWLNQTEHRPRVHRRDRRGRAYLWSKDTVKDMLTNAFYLGYVKHKDRLLPGKHEPIITQELFEKVKQVRKEHYRGPSTFAQRYRTYLLAGLARCVDRGSKLWAHHLSGHDYYQENASQRGIPCPNGKSYIRGDMVEDQVSKIISSLMLPTSWRELVIELLSSHDEAVEVQRERVRLEEKLRRLKRQYREVEIAENEYRRELELTQTKVASLVDPEQEETMNLGDHVEGLVSAWESATREEQRDMLRMMLEAIFIDMTTKEIE